MCIGNLFVLGIIGVLLWQMRPGAKGHYKLPSGMPYMEAVEQAHRETERTQAIFHAWVKLRMSHVDQLESEQPKLV
jgi:hypothetical protein